MERWRRILLIFELFLFALLLVLPQVDLPDFTLNRSTAPIVAKGGRSFAAILNIATITMHAPILHITGETREQPTHPAARTGTHSILYLFCILLC